ncbi:MAG: DUF58 domain-containing protein [Candidatus Thermoplasmatota archaeon]|nr:DUF58 domain-containing protein [Candidatus Thermoplasmatota archaeon]
MWTKKGQFMVILGAVLILSGLARNSYLTALAGMIMAAVVMISAILSTASKILTYMSRSKGGGEGVTKGIRFSRVLSSNRITEDDTLRIRLDFENLTRGRRMFEVMDVLPEHLVPVSGRNGGEVRLPGRGAGSIEYEVKGPVKGFYEIGPVLMRETDALRFFYDESEVDSKSHLKIYPRTFDVSNIRLKSKIPKLYAGSTLINKPGHGTEFFSLRDYVPGDPYKDIDWRSYARTRKLMVREHEMEAVIDLALIVDYRKGTGYGRQLNNLHLASARAAASITEHLTRRRDRVGLTIYGEKVIHLQRSSGSKNPDRILNRLAGEETKGEISLAEAVSTIIHDIRKGMPVVVITSMEGDETVYDGLKKLRAYGCDVTLIVPYTDDVELYDGEERDLHDRLMKEYRMTRISVISGLGVVVVEWNIEEPLNQAIARAFGGGRFR